MRDIITKLLVTEFNQYSIFVLTVHNIIFHEYLFRGSRVVPGGRKETRDEYQSGFLEKFRRTHSVKCRKTY